MASWSETKSESKPDSGAKSTDAIVSSGSRPEDGGNQSKPCGETQPSAGINIDNSGAAPSSEAPKAGAEGEPSLGKTLSAARERRGVSRDDVAKETRVPAHYIDMIERSDYGLISDQLYLMPFVRRYAAFLELDGEEVAMRFVREVQRAEGAAVPRMSEPLTLHDRKRTPWARVAVVIIVLAAIVVLYVIASEHHRGEFGFHRPAPPVDLTAPNAALAPAADAPAPAPVPAPMTVPVPMTAPAPMTLPPPQATAPSQMPQSGVVAAPTMPSAAHPKQKTPPSRATTPSDSEPE